MKLPDKTLYYLIYLSEFRSLFSNSLVATNLINDYSHCVLRNNMVNKTYKVLYTHQKTKKSKVWQVTQFNKIPFVIELAGSVCFKESAKIFSFIRWWNNVIMILCYWFLWRSGSLIEIQSVCNPSQLAILVYKTANSFEQTLWTILALLIWICYILRV